MGDTTNSLFPALFKRNAIGAIILVLALTVVRAFPRLYFPPWQIAALLLLCYFGWANLPLYKSGNRVGAILLAVIVVPALGFPCVPIAIGIGNFISAQQYRAKGLQLVNGCNGGAANAAYFELQKIDEYIKEVSETKDTNVLAQLQSARVMAKEKMKILNADCSRRGHRENHPWKTNWSGIKDTITNAENVIFNQ